MRGGSTSECAASPTPPSFTVRWSRRCPERYREQGIVTASDGVAGAGIVFDGDVSELIAAAERIRRLSHCGQRQPSTKRSKGGDRFPMNVVDDSTWCAGL
jgi:hypothetical protein